MDMRSRTKWPRNCREAGATLVEGALTMLITLMIIFSILEFGRIYGIYQTITEAAREGARFATQPCPSTATNAIDCNAQVISCTSGTAMTNTQVQSCVQRYMDAAHVSGATVNVTTQASTVNGVPLNYRSVQIAVPYTFLVLRFGTVTMHTQAAMRDELTN